MSKNRITAAVLLFISASLLFGCSSDTSDETKDNTVSSVTSSSVTEQEFNNTEINAYEEEPTDESPYEEKNIIYEKICRYEFIKECEVCGKPYNYIRIESSDYLTDEQIDKLNSDIDKLTENGLSGMDEKKHNIYHSDCYPYYRGNFCNPYESWKMFGLNLWIDQDYHSFSMNFYDPETCELLSWEDIFVENWLDYCTADDKYGTFDIIKYEGYITFYNPKTESIEVSLTGISESDENGNQDHTSMSGVIPLERVNKKYITEPEGWDEISDKMHQKNLQSK